MNVSELFPTKLSFILFVLYITLFVNQGWMVTLSQQSDNKYFYNTTLAVLFTEMLKWVSSIVIYSVNYPCINLLHDIKANLKTFALYMIPAALYCIYNNLSYINLSVFDPTTYFVVLQIRVVVTGVIFQVIFKKRLSGIQWLSLCLLTFGCMIKQLKISEEIHEVHEKQLNLSFSYSSFLLLAQVFSSCIAGVYNEYLLKSQAHEASVFVQNFFQSTNSIICIILVLLYNGELHILGDGLTLKHFLNIKVIMVVVNNAAIGVVTSFFLNYLNSILKTFASGLELIFTAIVSWILFGIPIYINTVFSIAIIIIATVIYSRNPVSQAKRSHKNIVYEKV